MNRQLLDVIEQANSIAISGHVRPDGDCVGSCVALALYLTKNYPEKDVHVYLQPVPPNLKVLKGTELIDSDFAMPSVPYDLFVALDCSSEDRLGDAVPIMKNALTTFAVDHHVTNTFYTQQTVVEAEASSTCEVLYGLLEPDKLDLSIAEALYLGIVHDTGVFKYSSTKESTMQIAGRLMSMGINTAAMIDDTFYRKSFLQNKMIGLATYRAALSLEDQFATTVLYKEDMDSYGATPADTEGIVEQLRIIKGVEVAAFAREDEPNTFKFSLRSNGKVDVATIASTFSGGGHRMAAGFTAVGTYDDILVQLSAMIMMQL